MATLVCTIEMDKGGGIRVVIDNDDDKITQTIHLDGRSLTMTVKGNDGTSTYTQDQKSITIKCKDFKVDAETITCESSKASKYISKDTMTLESTKDMVLKSQADVKISAVGEASLSGRKVALKSQTELEMAGASAKMQGTGNTEISGQMLKLSGAIKAELTGGMVDVVANTILTLKGTMVKIN